MSKKAFLYPADSFLGRSLGPQLKVSTGVYDTVNLAPFILVDVFELLAGATK